MSGFKKEENGEDGDKPKKCKEVANVHCVSQYFHSYINGKFFKSLNFKKKVDFIINENHSHLKYCCKRFEKDIHLFFIARFLFCRE